MKYIKWFVIPIILFLSSCETDPLIENNPPVIVFEYEDTLRVSLGEPVFFSEWVFGEDEEDGTIPCEWDFTGVDLETPGRYTATCTVKDQDGDSAETDVDIDVEDNTPPRVERLESHVNVYPVGSTIDFYSNMLILDNYDDELVIEIDDSLVLYNTPGTYNVTYLVTDDAGNQTEVVLPYILVSRVIPTFSELIGFDQENIFIQYEVVDPDGLFLRLEVDVKKGDSLVMVDSFFDTEYDIEIPVSPGTLYHVTMTYYYDLGNQGIVTRVITDDIMTDSWEVPIISYELSTVDTFHFDIDVMFNDTDDRLIVSTIQVLDGMDVLFDFPVTESQSIPITIPTTGKTYTVHLMYQYDLGDGLGIQTVEIDEDYVSPVLVAPTITTSNVITSTTEISFDIEIDRWEFVTQTVVVEILNGYTGIVEETVLYEPTALYHVDVAGLEMGTLYYIDITVIYDLMDGNGEVSKDSRTEATTDVIRLISVSQDDYSVFQGQTVRLSIRVEMDNSVGISDVRTDNMFAADYYGMSSVGDNVYILYVEIDTNLVSVGENTITLTEILYTIYGVTQPAYTFSGDYTYTYYVSP